MESRRNLLINLKVLSKLRPHQRIDTHRHTLSHMLSHPIPMASLTRWWSGARRSVDIARIGRCTKRRSQKSRKQMMRIHSDGHEDSIVGLEHFKTTYEGDSTSVANIEYHRCRICYTTPLWRGVHESTIVRHVTQDVSQPSSD